MFTNLLIPLDGSNLAEAALPAAFELAQKFNSTINLIMVVTQLPHEPLVVDDKAHDQLLDHLRGHQVEEAYRLMAEYEAKLKQRHEQINGLIVEGGPIDKAILKTAAEIKADAIVMSTHGRGGVSRLLFGSVAEKVIRQATIPVVLIRGKSL